MKKILFIFCLLFCSYGFAHDIGHEEFVLRRWHSAKENRTMIGSFFMFRNGNVYIEDEKQKILHFPLHSLSKQDQAFVMAEYKRILKLNNQLHTVEKKASSDSRFWIVGLLLIILWGYIIAIANKRKLKYFAPIPAFGLLLILYGFTGKSIRSVFSITDPLTVDSAFAPFKPNVFTRWDGNYFYVESKGLPNHGMMTGITSWQQQVPIPQCYTDTNAWSIPLNPVIAATPVPVNQQHFLRGAIAVAANGIAIFNPYTNTGVDAYLDGQLDNWGGHCGRADDYHYHIAPTHLYTSGQTTANLPIAYAFDGFAVYGSMEPDGITPMTTLDANHGHYGVNGIYHYHGTTSAPYMIGNMVGKVTEDSTLQIIPQARAFPVRPSLTPLSGATITGCIPNGTNNGYSLTYTRAGQNYSVDYSWTNTGSFTYNFVSPTGTTTSNYTNKPGHSCTLPGTFPLTIINFTARLSNNKVLLNWSTTNRVNTKSDIVERSQNGITWVALSSLTSPNTAGTLQQSFTDEAPKSTNYYRIKFLDKDGKFTYSNIQKVQMGKTDAGMIIYPNPATKGFSLQLGNDIQEKDVQQVTIFNLNGEKVFETLKYQRTMNIGKLTKGGYMVSIMLPNRQMNQRLIIQ